jgi:hypothetical protein
MDKVDKQDISEIPDQIQKKINFFQKICRIWLETIPRILNITCSQIKTKINHYKCWIVAWLILDCLYRNRKDRKNLADIKFYRTLEIKRKFRKYRRLSADKKNPGWWTLLSKGVRKLLTIDLHVGAASFAVHVYLLSRTKLGKYHNLRRPRSIVLRPVRLDLSAESAAIQQCFSLTTNQRTVLPAQ